MICYHGDHHRSVSQNCHSFDRLKSSVLHDHLIIDDVIVKVTMVTCVCVH